MSWTLTVTDLNDYVRRSLAGDPILQDVSLRGEISNFKRHSSGHLYFSLRDENSKIDCVMFRQYACMLGFEPQDGLRVVLRGSVSLYVATGSYQFYTENITLEGLGDLHIRFEELKKKLAAEGLFDTGLKKPLPLLPHLVGVVTASTGAVIHDIARVAGRRNPSVQFLLRPSKVQGDGAAEDIAQGIRDLQSVPGIDVIIIGRGGGSLEDLWAFNEEVVVRAIYACPIPIVSAVGHEVDVTLSDFAADVRAATPSAAAELVVQERAVLRNAVGELEARAFTAAADKLLTLRSTLKTCEKELAIQHPLISLRDMKARTYLLMEKLSHAVGKKLEAESAKLQSIETKLSALGPGQVLNRGYAIMMSGDKVISDIDQIQKIGQSVRLIMKNGQADAQITSIQRGDPFARETENI